MNLHDPPNGSVRMIILNFQILIKILMIMMIMMIIMIMLIIMIVVIINVIINIIIHYHTLSYIFIHHPPTSHCLGSLDGIILKGVPKN